MVAERRDAASERGFGGEYEAHRARGASERRRARVRCMLSGRVRLINRKAGRGSEREATGARNTGKVQLFVTAQLQSSDARNQILSDFLVFPNGWN